MIILLHHDFLAIYDIDTTLGNVINLHTIESIDALLDGAVTGSLNLIDRCSCI